MSIRDRLFPARTRARVAREALHAIASRPPEMARVFLHGRRYERAAVNFVGVPRVGRHHVLLLGTDGLVKASIPLTEIQAVQRVFVRVPAPVPAVQPVAYRRGRS